MSVRGLGFGEFTATGSFELVREYPHAVERVWDAITRPEEMQVWWVHFSKLELRQGGAYQIGAQGYALSGIITEFDPPHRICFGGLTRFELVKVEKGCRLVLTMMRWPNGWSPLQLAGFHAQLDQLELHLDGIPKDEIERRVDTWRHVISAYELLVQRTANAGRQVYFRIHFEPNSAELSPASRAALDNVIQILRANPALKLEIDGHCDDPCSLDESMALARRRIGTAAEHLKSGGIAPERMMKIAGANGLHRLSASDTEEGRAINRRVDLRPIY
jgi:outer membrane protein OmpA-like peptidoglycan-associated protein